MFSEYHAFHLTDLTQYVEAISSYGQAMADLMRGNQERIDRLKAHKGFSKKQKQITRLQARLDKFLQEQAK